MPFNTQDLLVFFSVLVVSACWAWIAVRATRARLAVPRLDIRQSAAVQHLPASRGQAGQFPPLDVIVAARNEQEVIEESVRSLLEQIYSSIRIIVVNDDSTDSTGAILDRLAEDHIHLEVIHNREVPAGWIGKCHALHLGAERAKAPWLLFTDADVMHDPMSAATAMRWVMEYRIDLLSPVPRLRCGGFSDELMMPVFAMLLTLAFPGHRVNDPECRDALAAGGYLLIRRSVYEAIGGHASVRDHIGEDLAMARRVKAAGYHVQIADGRDLSSTRMYDGFWDVWEGLTKHAFAGMNFKIHRALAGGLALSVAMFGPWALILASVLIENALLFSIACLNLALFYGVHAGAYHHLQVRFRSLPLAPVGYAIYLAALITSTYRCLLADGVEWKGRKYYGRKSVVP